MKKLLIILTLTLSSTFAFAQSLTVKVDSAIAYVNREIVNNTQRAITPLKLNLAYHRLIAAIHHIDSVGVGTTPALQAVTDIDYTTTNPLEFAYANITDGNNAVNITGASGGGSLLINAPTITGNRTQQLQNASGTIALTSDVKNIYNDDGTLTADRTIHGNQKRLVINDLDYFDVTSSKSTGKVSLVSVNPSQPPISASYPVGIFQADANLNSTMMAQGYNANTKSGYHSKIELYRDSILLNPWNGNLYSDSLNQSSDASDSALVWRSSGVNRGLFSIRAFPTATTLGVPTGSGTQNYVPKWNNAGGTALGNSDIYNSTTGVGINTTTPSGKFEVKATTSNNSATDFSFINSSGANLFNVRNDSYLRLGSGSLNSIIDIVGTGAASGIYSPGYSPSSTELLRLKQYNTGNTQVYMDFTTDQSPKVGIGTVSPDSMLTVQLGTNLKRGVLVSGNSFASLPVVKSTGTWYSGGTTTTTKPAWLIEESGASSTTWDVNGGALGINSAGYNRNHLQIKSNGVTAFGFVTTAAGNYANLKLGSYVGDGVNGQNGSAEFFRYEGSSSGRIYANSGAGLSITGASDITLGLNSQNGIKISTNGTWMGKSSITNSNATALVHIPAGTATASTAPFKLTAGTKLTTAEPGALEYVTGYYVLQADGLSIGTQTPSAKLHVTQSTPASVATTTVTAQASPLTIIGGTGGATSSSGSTVTAGAAGTTTITGGNGGAITGSPTTGIGGTGGTINITAGDGGLGTTFGGSAGVIEIQAGNGGGGTSGGTAGYAALKAGNAGSTGGANGGNVFLTTGAGQGAGNAGTVFLGVSPSATVRGNTVIGSATDDYANKLQVTGNVKIDGILKLKAYTVATLPTGAVGDVAYVTDATAPTYGATLVGGGAVKTIAFFDGTNWTAH